MWSHTWRLMLALPMGLFSGTAVYGAGIARAETTGTSNLLAEVWIVVDLAVLVVAAVLYVLRHRAPLPITGALVVLGSFSVFSAGIATLAVVSLSTRRRWGEISAVCALWFGAGLVADRALTHVFLPADMLFPPRWVLLLSVLVGMALPVVTGLFIGGRRALVASLREQAAIARREADARGDTARASERNRIAREMHDVLAHRLSLVALHAGALEYRAGLDPEQVRDTAAIVRENAHEALGELREVLGLLRDPTATDEQSRPQPTLAQVDELVDGTRAAGSPVSYVLDQVAEDDLARLPLSTSRHLYRVVQETLTNARKHAPGAPVKVRLHGAPGDRVGVEVTNRMPDHPPATPLPSSGWGLTGLAERLRLTGGELDVQRRADGTFAVQAWLPWAAGTEGQA
ncbi:hypothetical protein ATM99_17510 [Cellulomonas sp. B6]|nr:hypothetical protein ATM99_17510 [Cellulomonas sp. B6]